MQDTGFYISIGTALAVVGYAIRATWMVRTLEKEMGEHFDAEIDNVQRDIVKLERAGNDRAETLRQEFGETGASLRQFTANVEKKVYEVELWGRDNYAIKDDVKGVRDDIKSMAASIKQDFKELSAKIDARH